MGIWACMCGGGFRRCGFSPKARDGMEAHGLGTVS